MGKLKNYEPYKHTEMSNIREYVDFLDEKYSSKSAFMFQEKNILTLLWQMQRLLKPFVKN